MPVGNTVTTGKLTPAAGAEVHTAYHYATVSNLLKKHQVLEEDLEKQQEKVVEPAQ